MPYYLAIGVPEERILEGTPNDLLPFTEAFYIRQEIEDKQNWYSGMYTMNAVFVAISNALLGKKSKAKYFDKPIMQLEQETSKEIVTEETAKQQRENLLNMLKIMEINFNNSHKKDGEE